MLFLRHSVYTAAYREAGVTAVYSSKRRTDQH